MIEHATIRVPFKDLILELKEQAFYRRQEREIDQYLSKQRTYTNEARRLVKGVLDELGSL